MAALEGQEDVDEAAIEELPEDEETRKRREAKELARQKKVGSENTGLLLQELMEYSYYLAWRMFDKLAAGMRKPWTLCSE